MFCYNLHFEKILTLDISINQGKLEVLLLYVPNVPPSLKNI